MRLTRETVVTRDTCRTVLHRTVFCTFVSSWYYTSRKQPGSSLRGSRILENHCYGRESAAKITRVPLSTFSRETFANVRLQTLFFICRHANLDKDTNRSWKEYALMVKGILIHRYAHLRFFYFQFYTWNIKGSQVFKIIKKDMLQFF